MSSFGDEESGEVIEKYEKGIDFENVVYLGSCIVCSSIMCMKSCDGILVDDRVDFVRGSRNVVVC